MKENKRDRGTVTLFDCEYKLSSGGEILQTLIVQVYAKGEKKNTLTSCAHRGVEKKGEVGALSESCMEIVANFPF